MLTYDGVSFDELLYKPEKRNALSDSFFAFKNLFMDFFQKYQTSNDFLHHRGNFSLTLAAELYRNQEFNTLFYIDLIHCFIADYICKHDKTEQDPNSTPFAPFFKESIRSHFNLDITFDALFQFSLKAEEGYDPIIIVETPDKNYNNIRKYQRLVAANAKLPYSGFDLREKDGKVYCLSTCSKMAASIYKHFATSPWYTTAECSSLDEMISRKSDSYDFCKHFTFDNLCTVLDFSPFHEGRSLTDLYLFENLTGAATVSQLMNLLTHLKMHDFEGTEYFHTVALLFRYPIVFKRAEMIKDAISSGFSDVEMHQAVKNIHFIGSIAEKHYDEYFRLFFNLIYAVLVESKPDYQRYLGPVLRDAVYSLEEYISTIGKDSISTDPKASLYTCSNSNSDTFSELERCAVQAIYYHDFSFNANGMRK